MSDHSFPFIPMNQRQGKPRSQGLTEIRGPYYTAMGKRYIEDILETMGEYVDSLKFAGGPFTLMPRERLREIIELAHRNNVLVSTGGFIEYVLAHNPADVPRYIKECQDCGFDIVEVSCGFITLPTDDWLHLIERVQKSGLKAKPEVGIQFGAGGATRAEELEAEGTRDPAWAIGQARRFLDAGAYLIMIESEGITGPWRWIGGLASAAFGGLVGNQGGIRTAAMLGFDLSKESFVATATAIALVVDGARMPVYFVTQHERILQLWPIVLVATTGVIGGTWLGTYLIDRIPERIFKRVVSLIVLGLGVFMFFRPGS
jgi:phosphosulfolactate synthase (CoM biosynthesis protein A)